MDIAAALAVAKTHLGRIKFGWRRRPPRREKLGATTKAKENLITRPASGLTLMAVQMATANAAEQQAQVTAASTTSTSTTAAKWQIDRAAGGSPRTWRQKRFAGMRAGGRGCLASFNLLLLFLLLVICGGGRREVRSPASKMTSCCCCRRFLRWPTSPFLVVSAHSYAASQWDLDGGNARVDNRKQQAQTEVIRKSERGARPESEVEETAFRRLDDRGALDSGAQQPAQVEGPRAELFTNSMGNHHHLHHHHRRRQVGENHRVIMESKQQQQQQQDLASDLAPSTARPTNEHAPSLVDSLSGPIDYIDDDALARPRPRPRPPYHRSRHQSSEPLWTLHRSQELPVADQEARQATNSIRGQHDDPVKRRLRNAGHHKDEERKHANHQGEDNEGDETTSWDKQAPPSVSTGEQMVASVGNNDLVGAPGSTRGDGQLMRFATLTTIISRRNRERGHNHHGRGWCFIESPQQPAGSAGRHQVDCNKLLRPARDADGQAHPAWLKYCSLEWDQREQATDGDDKEQQKQKQEETTDQQQQQQREPVVVCCCHPATRDLQVHANSYSSATYSDHSPTLQVRRRHRHHRHHHVGDNYSIEDERADWRAITRATATTVATTVKSGPEQTASLVGGHPIDTISKLGGWLIEGAFRPNQTLSLPLPPPSQPPLPDHQANSNNTTRIKAGDQFNRLADSALIVLGREDSLNYPIIAALPSSPVPAPADDNRPSIIHHITSEHDSINITSAIVDYFRDMIDKGQGLVLVLGLIILITFVGNVLVCLSVIKVRKLRHPSNYLLISLAISDLCVACVVMPFGLYQSINDKWQLGTLLCNVYVVSDVASCTASILNLCVISIDRYLAITRPLTYCMKRTTRLMMILIGVVWSLACLISVPPLLISGNEYGTAEEPRCEVSQSLWYQLYATCISFYIPLIVMICLYYNIYTAAKRVIEAEQRATTGLHANSTSSVMKERKASITLGVIMSAFTICWLPFFIIALLRPFSDTVNNLPRWFVLLTLWLGYANSLLNPIIYVTFHHDFRHAFKHLLCLRCMTINEHIREDEYKSQYGETHYQENKRKLCGQQLQNQQQQQLLVDKLNQL